MLTKLLYIVCFVLVLSVLTYSKEDANKWITVNPPTLLGGYEGVVYGNGTYVVVRFVAAGYITIFYTEDPSHWEESNIVAVPGKTPVTVLYTNDTFVVFNQNMRYSSSDGQTFEAQQMTITLGTWLQVQEVTNNSLFKYATWWSNLDTEQAFNLVSADGVTWTQSYLDGHIMQALSVCSLGDTLLNVYTMYKSGYFVTQDLKQWTQVPVSHFGNITDTAYWMGTSVLPTREVIMVFQEFDPDKVVYVYSQDKAKTFSRLTYDLMPNTMPVYFNNKYYVYYSNGFYYSSSLNSPTWLKGGSYPGGAGSIAAAGDYLFVMSTTLGYSSDLMQFTVPNIDGLIISWQQIFIINNGDIVLMGANTTASNPFPYVHFYGIEIDESNGSFTLVHRSISPFEGSQGSFEANGTFYFRGYDYLYATSDFIKWTTVLQNFPPQMTGIVYFDNAWFVATDILLSNYDYTPYIYRSDSLKGNWTRVFVPPISGNYSKANIASLNGILAIQYSGLYPYDGFVFTSSDGLTWKNASKMPQTFASYMYSAGQWLYMLTSKAFIGSNDGGLTWQPISIPLSSATISYNEVLGIYFAVGASNIKGKVATSVNGLDWTISNQYSVPTIQGVIQITHNQDYIVAINTNSEVQIIKM